MNIDAKRLARWRAKIVKPDGEAGCWEWTAQRQFGGYGVFRWSTELRTTAHRAGYRLLVGDIPAGYEIDHLCRNRGCVNPSHLEAVTRQENHRRGVPARGIAMPNARKTHCPNGHPYLGDNLRLYDDGTHRVCVTCNRDRNRAWRAARKAA